MYREFIITQDFDKYWKMAKLDDDALRDLQNILLDNPKSGSVISKTNGLRKIRTQIIGRGKRGGMRIIYLDIERRRQSPSSPGSGLPL
jgi:mRNA-degrading endonuclease RelE of RelBE toxin-antitoxin system